MRIEKINLDIFLHFVIQTPGLQGEAAQADKVPVLRSRLGL
jgi:hypothetical protein